MFRGGHEEAQRDLLENSEEVEARLRAGEGKAQERLRKMFRRG